MSEVDCNAIFESGGASTETDAQNERADSYRKRDNHKKHANGDANVMRREHPDKVRKGQTGKN